jgi:hypothetical protein
VSTLATDAASQSYTCTATSGADLVGSATVTVKRDASAPVIAGEPAGTLGANGWYVSDVSVPFAASDDVSGILSSTGCAPVVQNADVATATFTCTATNNAGLQATQSFTVKRDATKPVVAFAGNAGVYTVDQTVAITCSASDALGGLTSNGCANVSGAAYTFAIGANALSATAVDNAGNASTATGSFTVSVTNASLCALTKQWTSRVEAWVLCAFLERERYELYAQAVRRSVPRGITKERADILISLAANLGPITDGDDWKTWKDWFSGQRWNGWKSWYESKYGKDGKGRS